MGYVDALVNHELSEAHKRLAEKIQSDLIFYYGPMNFETPRIFEESIATNAPKRRKLSVVLTTGGGAVEPVERAVEIIRQQYQSVHFIVPDYAMSAGTIFCMSGNKISMSKSSSLGPIDPQVPRHDGTYVPAMGYLEQFEKIVKKSKTGEVSPAEIDMLRRLDLGDLNRFEQARNLTVTLLKKWLVNYKFKYWKTHRSTPGKKGLPVTMAEKETRAEDIAKKLGDISIWHSHGRHICIETLRNELKLKIEDYTSDVELSQHIEIYHGLAVDYIKKNGYILYVHNGRTLVSIGRS